MSLFGISPEERRRGDRHVNRRKKWVCPYFHWDGEWTVRCKAGKIVLPNRTYANDYMNRYCAKDWDKCTLAQQWNDYYENEVDDEEQGVHGADARE